MKNNNGVYSIDYSGTIILLTKEKYSSLLRENQSLKEKYSKLRDDCKRIIEELKNREKAYKQRIQSLENENENLKKTCQVLNTELAKFRQGNPKVKFTPEMQKVALVMRAKGLSITKIHQYFAKKGADISYETVRRFLSSKMH